MIHPTGALTYREIDLLAETVAADLRAIGVQPRTFVPLLLDDPLALLASMLGTMKAAAAFVPFDLAWPAERQVTLLGELRAQAVIGQPPPNFPLPLGPVTVSTSLTRMVTAPPDLPRPAQQDPIYGFFTSGSTGRPKCAVNIHRGLVNRLVSMTERFADDGAAVLQNSAHTFDSSIWQLLWPLTRGARVVIPDRNSILDFDATLAEIGRHRVTMTDFVPTIFDLLVERLGDRPQDLPLLSSMRQVLIGGETVNPQTVRAFRTMLPGVRVTNTYGPTEASIGSVFHLIGDDDRDVIPLGRPIPNTWVLLIGEDGRPARRGRLGEIYLGGSCLGAGYHGDPARTRDTFVPNPYPEAPGRTLYRTGDFGWVRDDGMLMFSGRRDAQVQIAGLRVDLGEVEAALASVAGVRQVKVIVHGAGPAASLVCFYSACPPVPASELRAHARMTLPDGLVPSRFVGLDELPLLANGKVDQQRLRSRLSRDEPRGEVHGTRFPSGSVEAGIAGAWKRVLGVDQVGGDFFHIGGTSLSAARLAVELERAYQVPVSVRDLVHLSSITAQAEFIRSGRLAPTAPDHTIRGELERYRQSIGHRTAPRRMPPDSAAVLLVGATGFIGMHILETLLELTERPIICVARAGDDGGARDRIDAALAAVGRPGRVSRVSALAGDLRAAHLGLPRRAWARLGREVGVIVDAGGLVDSLRDYAALRATNVTGTRTLIELAGEHVRKRVISLSTTTVRGGPGVWLPEEFLPWDSPVPTDGYSQSKWVAEQFLHAAANRGIPATVVRLGEVAAHSRTGQPNPRSLVTMILRLCSRLGARFHTNARVDWTPVDSVARLVAACVQESPSDPGAAVVLNAVAPASVSLHALMTQLRSPDSPLPQISYGRFLDRAAQAVGDDDVARCLAVFRPRHATAADPLAGVVSDASAATDTSRAARLAAQLGLAWDRYRDREVRNMIEHLPHATLRAHPPGHLPFRRSDQVRHQSRNPPPALETT